MKGSVLDSQKQADLLVHLVEQEKQNFKLNDCLDIYSTKKHAESSVKSLISYGFVERKSNRTFKLLGIPPELESRVDIS